MSETPASQDDYLGSIGRIVQNASACDLILVNVLRIVSKITHQTAKDICFSLDSLRARHAIINTIAKRTLKKNRAAKATLEKILQSSVNIAKKRNELAHSCILLTGDGQVQRSNPRNSQQPTQPATREYLKSMIDPTFQEWTASHENYETLCKQLGVSPRLLL